MKITSQWIKKHKSLVDNGRKDAIVMDLPQEKGGDDFAATALEFMVMSLAGCITTIFSLVAKNSNIEIDSLRAIVDASIAEKALTITEVDIEITVKANATEEKIRKIKEITLNQCPVEQLFRQANVKMTDKLIIL